jgi:dipeptidyl aminopeptidase/acylaminoacyl peptidase
MKMQKLLCALVLLTCNLGFAADKPKLTFDEFFNFVDYPSVKLSPDGLSVVICAERADWAQNIFRKDLWLYRDSALTQLTRSGHDSDPQWSPDGKWIAFLSDRKVLAAEDTATADPKDDTAQLYVISPAGGEAIPVTTAEEEVHAFAWAGDSKSLYFATRQPLTKDEKDAHKKDWKDVIRYRDGERGDTVFSIDVAGAMAKAQSLGTIPADDSNDAPDSTPGSKALAKTPWHIGEIASSPDGQRLAFATASVSERQERIEEFEVFVVDLAGTSPDQAPKQLTRNEAIEQNIRWTPDSKHILFEVEQGSVEGKYKDAQKRLYWVDAGSAETQRWAGDFTGSVNSYSVSKDGVVASARVGTEVQIYTAHSRTDKFSRQSGWAGTYDHVETAPGSPKIALIYSAFQKPTEIYIADSIEKLQDARPITSFNKLFTERDLPQAKPYQWKADDGATVEGMLIYPPGKFEAKNLPMFVLIHGGPADADGNHFEADWYQWDRLAAGAGWLVFEPNYRGSTGYGDKFLAQIVPEIVSRPGKDILEGVDQLVKDGTADASHLTIGGYSYGSYMTNWLITQTTRFKAAVTGAGAVEHIANWGNDDMTFDDAYFLGGVPWEAPQRYHDEAAIFQINKVKTPTHIVGGEDDIRVAVAEDYLLDHALHNLRIPSTLLIFPGEGHSLSKNPWHGKIKVREEIKWLQKYGEMPGN